MTYLAVPIAADSLDEAERMIRCAEQAGAELIELRLDLLPPDAAGWLPRRTTLPVLATCRDHAEGGLRIYDDMARAQQLLTAARAGARYVDLEWATWQRSPLARQLVCAALKPKDCGLILSAHDFTGPLAKPGQVVQRMRREVGCVAKIAYQANRVTECFAALDILHSATRPKPAIALAMGEAGVITRLLARKLRAFLTFAALDEGQGTAPGQPTLREFKELYRWDRIGPATQLFGVIGCPVAHSLSPAIHNAAFDAAGYDGLYLPLLVEPDAATFDGLLDGIRWRNDWLSFRGLSVTLPHKENALRYVLAAGGRVDPLSLRIGAINTIRFEGDGSLSGRNTDYAAALDAACDGLGCDRAGLAGRRVAVLGAGGAARAIVAGFADAGADVAAFNRTLERAEKLAAEFRCRALPLNAQSLPDAEVVVNATSVGMHPNVDQSPLPGGGLRPGQLIFDTVYNPIQTLLLRQAAAAGARVVDGVAMFVRQAAAQFEWWTGLPAPAELMRRVALSRLAPDAKHALEGP